ncbi:serine/threonine-protein kinase [Mariniluteicoccus endophyticus]
MDQIGRYRIVRRLGAGTFATVWLGEDDELDVTVAVKVLAENWADNEDVRSRFIAEARHMRRIRDPRLVRVYDIGELDDGRPYFVMDYCDSGSMSDLRANPIAPAATLRLCSDACLALEAIHRANVIHRDVTPGNLLLDRRDDGALMVQLADLGVAKSMLEDQGQTMTAGTPAFMAPEQASGAPMDARADVYAMACVVYAVLTGKPPFQVKTLGELISRGADVLPQPIARRVGAPKLLDDLLVSALSLDPRLRPASAAEFARVLDEIVDQMPQDEAMIATRARPREAGVLLPPTTSFPGPGQVPPPSPHTHPGYTTHYPGHGSPQSIPPQQLYGPPTGPHPMSPMTQMAPQQPAQKRYWGYNSAEWLLISTCAVVLFCVTLFVVLKVLG